MNFKKIISILTICFLLFCFNETIVKNAYLDYTMFSSYNQKSHIANLATEKKAIIVGGSASNLGFDSEYLSKKLDIPVINMAISAGVPLSIYMKIAELHSDAGDTIFLVLENSYWNSEPYNIDESYVDMLSIDKRLKIKNTLQHNFKVSYTEFFRSFSRLNDFINYKLQDVLDGGSIYIANSVNENGDFILHKNLPSEYKRKISTAKKFELNCETAEQIKVFINRMQEKNIRVLLSYAPQDGNRFTNSHTYFEEMRKVTEEYFGSENIIGKPSDFSYNDDFFFDTEYHLKFDKKINYTEDFYNQYIKN